ncbi:hypothetical protein [Brucella abortus]|uniref:hypothetical protein n=1 Tax=Brucella abortus TaxID=235 RepID=UPI003D2656CC
MSRCRWITDPDVPGGRFLVPGCWNRAINGDQAECHRKDGTQTTAERLEAKIDKLIARMDHLESRAALRERE